MMSLGLESFELVGEFGEGVERVGSGGNCANGGDGEEGDREEGGVLGEDEDDIIFGDVEVEEPSRGTSDISNSLESPSS